MAKYKQLNVEGYEKVIEMIDEEAGLHGFIAVHDTHMGPALGGTRIYPYASREEALTDALRLAKGMTYKSAVAETGLGGGKSVIIADPKTQKTEKLLLAFGRAVDSLEGCYICAEDMGTTPADMAVVHRETNHVAALFGGGGSGDPSPYTAWGCFRGIQAVAHRLWGNDSVAGKRVAIQGLGAVGIHLAEFLFWHGAHLIVADIDKERVEMAMQRFGADIVAPNEILAVECDILAPCAMGGILNDATIPNLHCQAIVGSANNQLLEARHGNDLVSAGIVYAPDFVVNAGGIINVAVELGQGGYNSEQARDKVGQIYETLVSIFNIAEKRGIPTSMAADELAQHKLRYRIGRRPDSGKHAA